ncbi:UNVERIFIED_CONTAM: hypothetical protein HCY04_04555 [Limosilactobacillus fermentum]
MAKTLMYVVGSPTSVKIGDTDTTLILQLKLDSEAIDLSNAKSITVKIGNSQGYIKDISVILTNQPSLADGTINLNSSDLLDDLVVGTYYFEVWVTNSDSSVDIYPDTDYPQTVAFDLVKNVESATGAEWSTNYNKLKAAIIALGGKVD